MLQDASPTSPATSASVAPVDVGRPDAIEPSQAEVLHRSRNASVRIPILDGIRASAAILVFLGHATVLTGLTPLDTLWRRLLTLNGLGASVFFVLSGFLVTEVLVKADRSPRYFFWNFYARRALRLLPLYWALIFFSFVILPNLPANLPMFDVLAKKMPRFLEASPNQWMYWSGLANFAIQKAGGWKHGILDVSWSLAIEFQFYVCWPLFIYFLSRRQVVWLSLVMIFGSLAFRLLAIYQWGYTPVQVYVSTFARLGAFGTGSLVCLVLRDPQFLLRIRPIATTAALLVLPTIWGLMWFEDAYGSSYLNRYGLNGGPLSYSVLNTIVGIGVGGLIVRALAATEQGRLSRVFSSKPLASFAKYSYAFFLFHLPIRAAIRDLCFGPARAADAHYPLVVWPTVWGSQIPSQLVFYVISFVASFFAAFLAWHLYEKHWLKFNRYFPSRPRTSKPAISEARPGGG